ncbi:hypothetical protein JOC34_000548 [Virgibacillus halotolerans]|uniref:hypothetical protein n=1 Tax=Virgibacillus halotolerans TaxID=1071053 RepID=UPI0019600757|nr:hypothetical protein [Virgibacillus halotolerans]MBM7598191.1 hypothetical protein [Virgibacillus halotolerans]
MNNELKLKHIKEDGSLRTPYVVYQGDKKLGSFTNRIAANKFMKMVDELRRYDALD